MNFLYVHAASVCVRAKARLQVHVDPHAAASVHRQQSCQQRTDADCVDISS